MGPGQLRVTIYINFVELENILLHAKFYDHRTISSVGEEDFFQVFTINEHGGHLGHVTCTIYISFLSYFPRRLHIKFGFDWRRRSQRRSCLIIMVIYMYIAPGQGQTTPWGQSLFINNIIWSV